MDIKVVEKPVRGGGAVKDELVEKLMELKGTSQAVEVALGKDFHFVNWQSTLRNRLRKHGLKLHARLNKASKIVTCWVEDLD